MRTQKGISVVAAFALIAILLLTCGFIRVVIVDYFTGAAWYGFFAVTAALITAQSFKSKKMIISSDLFYFFVFSLLYSFEYLLYVNAPMTDLMGVKVNLVILQLFENLLVFIIASFLRANPKYDTKVCFILVVAMIINMFFTFRALAIDPNISKNMSTSDASVYTTINTTGVVGYDVIYSCVFLLPLLLPFIFSNSIKRATRVTVLFLTAAILVLQYSAGYYISFFILLLLALLLTLFYTRKTVKYLLAIPIAVTSMLLFNKASISALILRLADNVNVYNLSERLRQTAYFLLYNEKGDAFSRFDYYSKSITSFLRYPILGQAITGNSYEISRHAEILDIAAIGGIFLLAFYAVFLVAAYKRSVSFTANKYQNSYIKSLFICYLVFNCIDTSFSSPMILFSLIYIAPMLIRRYNNTKLYNDSR